MAHARGTMTTNTKSYAYRNKSVRPKEDVRANGTAVDVRQDITCVVRPHRASRHCSLCVAAPFYLVHCPTWGMPPLMRQCR